MASRPTTTAIYRLKVTLRGTKPPIWRRLEVPGTVTLHKLHDIIQAAMGWYDCHLYEFSAGDRRYGVPDPDWGDSEVRSSRRVRLRDVAPAVGTTLLYEYDFGDDWEHSVLVEHVGPPEPGQTYPVCLKGRRACPPEDCGGVWGYARLLEVLRDPTDPEHEETKEWLGRPLDPEAFDLEAVNRRLRAGRL